MDDKLVALEKKLDDLLRQAAEVSVALDRARGVIKGVPHYSEIEQRAHQLGQQFSRQLQRLHMAEIAVCQPSEASCPQCGRRCALTTVKRTVKSIDGPVELQELKGYCGGCRRSFFPSAGGVGI